MKALSSSFLVGFTNLCLLYLVVGISATTNGIHHLWKDAFSPAFAEDVSFPSLHIRRQEGIISTNITQNNTLLEAERILKAAQEEARIRNKYLVEHVRKNKYEFRASPASLEPDNKTGTGVNATVRYLNLYRDVG